VISTEICNNIDRLWHDLRTIGGLKPKEILSQLALLLTLRLIEVHENVAAEDWARKYPEKPNPGKYFPAGRNWIRWPQIANETSSESLMHLFSEGLPSQFPDMGKSSDDDKPNPQQKVLRQLLSDSQILIHRPQLLMSVVKSVDALPIHEEGIAAEIYDYLLNKSFSARSSDFVLTPRHVIDLMVDLTVDGREHEAGRWQVADPACGIGSFIVQFIRGLRKRHPINAPRSGDLDPLCESGSEGRSPIGLNHELFVRGFDANQMMCRLSALNLFIEGIETPCIYQHDTLSMEFNEHWTTRPMAEEAFDLILSTPPFRSYGNEESGHRLVTTRVRTKKMELLSVLQHLKMLRQGGRCAMLVPDSMTFGSSAAHQQVRKILVDENRLEAVIRLPSGVFRPHAAISTAILLFTRGGRSEDILFFDVQADGRTLDDKREKIGPDNSWQDLDVLREAWKKWNNGQRAGWFQSRTEQAFCVSAAEIAANGFDLSVARYKEIACVEPQLDPPESLIAQLRSLESEIAAELQALEGLL
jgi:type I restriction enzyme M protein